ncbi:MAG: hypothetical protein IJ598_01220 [Ruminococcus sp.]|nr:hypothetical protein [Ruminococcus sp.]
MKWNNCTPEEAQEAYDYAKSRYQNAAEEYLSNKKKLDAFYGARGGLSAQTASVRGDKLNFEKRIEEIGDILTLLSDGGKVDEAVGQANAAAKVAEAAMAQSIVCSGVNSPSLASIFRCPTVSENTHSVTARDELRKEKNRLEQALADINAKLNALELELQQMTGQMNALASMQNDLSRTMHACSYEMNHYKKYT